VKRGGGDSDREVLGGKDTPVSNSS